MNRCSTYDKLGIGFNVFLMMTLIDPDPQAFQVLDFFAFGNIRTGDGQPHAEQDFGQRCHGDAADSDKMALPAGS